MADAWESTKANCFIEFRVMDKRRFEILQRFFDALRTYTQNEDIAAGSSDTSPAAPLVRPTDETQESAHFVPSKEETLQRNHFAKPEEWLLVFRPADLDYLNLPDHKKAILTIREWQGLSRRERRKSIKAQDDQRSLQMLADFVDMLRYWQDVEYELVDCDMHDADRGRITYSTFKYPFEGKAALEEMLLFFGFFAIINDSC